MTHPDQVAARKALREALARLYNTSADASRVVEDSGMPCIGIDLSGSARTMWHNVISEAQKLGTIGGIIDVALSEFPKNHELRSAVETFLIAQRLGDVSASDLASFRHISIGRLPMPGQHFVGREDELKELGVAWHDGHTHIVSVVGWGGSGKSTLVAQWSARMAAVDWLGAMKIFDWSFYSQGSAETAAVSADAFISKALAFFGDVDPTRGRPWEKGERLAGLIRRQPTLLIIDGLEPIQAPERQGGRLRDQALEALLVGLAAEMNGLCVVTTRQPIAELEAFLGRTAKRVDLARLADEDGMNLLRLCGVCGESDELLTVVRAMKGHALTLNLLGRYIADALVGDVRRWSEVSIEDDDVDIDERARKLMSTYDRWLGDTPERAILRLMGLFDRPATPECLRSLRKLPAIPNVTGAIAGISDAKWNMAINRLRRLELVTVNAGDGALDAHPLVRAGFGDVLRNEQPAGYRGAHGRLYKKLLGVVDKPLTLEGMQPLYQAIWHACKAGLYRDAVESFVRRIRRGEEAFSTYQLGAHGADLAAFAGFFDRDWSAPVADLSAVDQAWLLSEVAMSLHALGRTREAKEPRQKALEMYILMKAWGNASIQAVNLSSIHESLGELQEALLAAVQCVALVDRTKEVLDHAVCRAQQAHVLHLLGRRAEARMLFEESERMQVGVHPKIKIKFPFLSSVQGVFFCELLLECGDAESVLLRAQAGLVIASSYKYILDMALDRLSLARAHHALGNYSRALDEFQQAVEGLRAAGEQHWLASALIHRAAFFRATGKTETAQRDIQEALRIADRCELQLVECDAWIEQARLSIEICDHGAVRISVEKARALVTRCCYGNQNEAVSSLELLLRSTP